MIHVVTSCSPKGWGIYGKRFVDSFLKHWPSSVQLHVFLESSDFPLGYPQVLFHDLEADREHEEFCEKWSGPEWNDPRDFNAQSTKFCHKVFAITSPELPTSGWRIWVDADVVSHAAPDIASLLPATASVCYLGRDPHQWIVNAVPRPICSETGFVAYDMDDLHVHALLADMRRWYTTGELFTRPKTDWHDAKCFDVCLARSEVASNRRLSYSEKAKGTDVWPQTQLASWGHHYKGPRRKAAVYGAVT